MLDLEVGFFQIDTCNYINFEINPPSTFNPEIAINEKSTDGNFVLVASGGLENIVLISNIIDWDAYFALVDEVPVLSDDMVPDLIIIADSQRALAFWMFLRRLIAMFNSVDAIKDYSDALINSPWTTFLDPLLAYCAKNVDLSPNYNAIANVTELIIEIIDLIDEERYEIFTRILSKSCIISNFWSNTALFMKIASAVAGRQVFINAGDSVEKYAVLAGENCDERLLMLTKNMELLAYRISFHMRQTAYMSIPLKLVGQQNTSLFEALTHKKFKPLSRQKLIAFNAVLFSEAPRFVQSVSKLQVLFRNKNVASMVKRYLGMHDAALVDYRIIAEGNESDFVMPQHLKVSNPKFNFVGTGCIRSLEIIKTMIDWDAIPEVNDQSIVPKLFIVDYSRSSRAFWKFVKYRFSRLETLEKFDEMIRTLDYSDYNFESDPYVKYLPPNMCIDMEPTAANKYRHIASVFNVFFDCADEKEYKFLRSVILNASFVARNWLDPDFNATLAKHLRGQKNYVYASNICECFDKCHFSNEEIEKQLHDFIQHICNLKPIFTAYSRTPLDVYRDNHSILPSVNLIVEGFNARNHSSVLRQANYAPLTPKEIELYDKMVSKETQESSCFRRKYPKFT